MVKLKDQKMVEEIPDQEDKTLGSVKWVGLASVKCHCFVHVKTDDSGRQRRLPCSMMLYGEDIWTQLDSELDLWYQQAAAFRGEDVDAEYECHRELAKQVKLRLLAARKTVRASKEGAKGSADKA